VQAYVASQARAVMVIWLGRLGFVRRIEAVEATCLPSQTVVRTCERRACCCLRKVASNWCQAGSRAALWWRADTVSACLRQMLWLWHTLNRAHSRELRFSVLHVLNAVSAGSPAVACAAQAARCKLCKHAPLRASVLDKVLSGLVGRHAACCDHATL
jgi:hypothetical protein